MSGEEMEISTDLGHHVLGEDIDIDLEFTSGQHDEDLELGDYNQAEEFQHFNSDNRDELMAEDDNASYGMADADDISYDETAVAATDYDIVIGDTDVYSWQEDDAPNDEEGLIPADGGEATNHVDAQGPESSSAKIAPTDSFLQAESSALEPVTQDHFEGVTELFQAVGEADSEGLVAEVDVNVDDIANQNLETASNKAIEGHAARSQGVSAEAEQQLETLDTEHNIVQKNLEDPPRNSEHGLLTADKGSLHANDTSGVDENHTGSFEGEDDEIGYDLEAEDGLTEEGFTSITNTNVEPDDSSRVEDQAIATGAAEVPAGDDTDFTADGYQLGDDSFEHVDEHSIQETREQDSQKTEELEQQHASPVHNNHEDPSKFEDGDSEERDRDGADPGSVVEDIALIAGRHTMVVHYGETDYRLFANKPEDDPSEYFFKDLSGLELPLADFLSGIRSVISEEVSPLDELVLHIDGLGLEFGESTTGRVLEGYTFGHILSLYDSLVQNDAAGEAVEAPELYMYLMVRPNCLQRLKALHVQAASGRSLTDVAVYREASPAQENDAGAGVETLTVSPDYVEEEFYDNLEQSDEEPFHQEHSGDESQLTAPEGIQASQHHDDVDKENVGDAEDLAGDHIEDAVDYDNLDLSPSQQDQTNNATNDVTTAAETSLDDDYSSTNAADTAAAIEEQPEFPPSEATSATVTLDEDPNDEIDYDENDFDVSRGVPKADNAAPAPSTKLMAPVDEEISWESENEEARNEQSITSKPSEQVSTTPGKRTRSGSDAAAITGDRKDVKRQRS